MNDKIFFENNLKLQTLADWNKDKSSDTQITESQLQSIKDKNNLDLQLYAFAKDLFYKRVELLKLNSDLKNIDTINSAYTLSNDTIDKLIYSDDSEEY